MDEHIKQIAARLNGLREILNISPEKAAAACQISPEQYLTFESGNVDIPVGILHRLSQLFGISLTTLMTGEEPHMSMYSLTRKGKGIAVERRKAYRYQALAHSFKNRKAEPFIVRVEPSASDAQLDFGTHQGHEFNMVLSGSMTLFLNGKEMLLEEGDSIYFDSGFPHAMKATNNQACEFLAIIF